MSKLTGSDTIKNQKINNFVIAEGLADFLNEIRSNPQKTMEVKLSQHTRYIKARFVEKTKETYIVFSPFKYDWEHQNHDILTGLPNRELFFDRSLQIIHRCERTQSKMALIFMDLDGFKPVNDNYGHKAGDIVLQVISKRLEQSLRKTDTIARFGGDEFVLAISDLKEGIHASLSAKRILKQIELPINIGDKKVSVSASLGISIFPEDGNSVKELVKKADEAMYKSKNQNRGYSFFNMTKYI